MTWQTPRAWRFVPILLAITALSTPTTRGAEDADSAPQAEARQILDAAGVQGGLIVHLGCGDGTLTGALGAENGTLVHGLDGDPANVAAARDHVRSLGRYGKVAIEQWAHARLPYADNLVNLIVCDRPAVVSTDEIMRVLAPGGVAYMKQDGQWTKTVKPRPEEIDEWTHTLYDASGNAVGEDLLVGPPRSIQWVGPPRRARQHERLASVSAVVSSGGRVFSIEDRGSIASVVLPAHWLLVARDAFSGVELWRRPLGTWEDHLRPFRMGPPDLSRRLVAVGERVYVTLGLGRPVEALDAATGETLRTYAATDGTSEILHHDGVLYLVAGGAARKAAAAERRGDPPPDAAGRRILAVRADSGELVWTRSDDDTKDLLPTTLAVGGGRVFFQNPREIHCLDAADGKTRWSTARPVTTHRPDWSAPTLVYYEEQDVLFSADRAAPGVLEKKPGRKHHSAWIDSPKGELIAFAAATGEQLWSCECREGFHGAVDVLVADGLVWTGELAHADDPGITAGRDPLTGEIKRRRPRDQEFFQVGMPHHRCHRNRATEQYLVLARAGIELIDLTSGRAIPHHWVRGTCQFGTIPCNGLLYVPPHSCACYLEAKLNGFYALSAAGADEGEEEGEREGEGEGETGERLVRGPAYSSSTSHFPLPTSADWPTLRHDAARSGATSAEVPAELHPAWKSDLGARPSSLTVAAGKVFVAAVDEHRIAALDAETGEPLWSFTAGGRVDSPPTIYVGRTSGPSPDTVGRTPGPSNNPVGRTPGPSNNPVGRTSSPSNKSVARSDPAAMEDGLAIRPTAGDGPGGHPTKSADGSKVRPTVLCLFGSADGYVYCLRADDGELVWRFRAAPRERRVVSYGQVESAWPVHGSVLVEGGVACFAAGRSSYLDGGIRLYRLEAATGKLLSETRLDSRDPETGHQPKGVVSQFDIPGALPDVLSSDGELLYMRQRKFDRQGNPLPGGGRHLYSPTGLLDDTWWHRSYWIYGSRYHTGYRDWFRAGREVPGGRILVFDDRAVYGFGRKPKFYYWSTPLAYQLFAADKQPEVIASADKRPRVPDWGQRQIRHRWTGEVPALVRAMVLASGTLFLAGPPELIDEERAYRDPTDPAIAARLAEQEEAARGDKGSRLWAVSAADGRKLAERALEGVPVFDGMAATPGRLYLAMADGRVVCLAGE